jgi:DNA-binding NarL/FixJ family response regulator
MSKPNIQIDGVVREMTDEEHESYLEVQKDAANAKKEQEAKAASRQSALAKLAALGLTEDEIAAL